MEIERHEQCVIGTLLDVIMEQALLGTYGEHGVPIYARWIAQMLGVEPPQEDADFFGRGRGAPIPSRVDRPTHAVHRRPVGPSAVRAIRRRTEAGQSTSDQTTFDPDKTDPNIQLSALGSEVTEYDFNDGSGVSLWRPELTVSVMLSTVWVPSSTFRPLAKFDFDDAGRRTVHIKADLGPTSAV